jgi:hypothetical protein
MRLGFLTIPAVLLLPCSPVQAALIPPSGWTAHKIVGDLAQPLGGLTVDPISHDAFVGDHGPAPKVWRITQAGIKTAIIPDATGSNVDAIAFDPVARVLYVPAGTGLLRYDENGVLLGQDAIAPVCVALGPDGAIYGAFSFAGADPSHVMRRDPATAAWSEWRALTGPFSTAVPYHLSLDPGGRIFAGSDLGLLRLDAGTTVKVGNSLLGGRLPAVSSGSSSLFQSNFTFDPAGGDQGWGVPFVSSDDNSDGLIYGVWLASDGSAYMTAIGTSPGGNGSLWQFVPSTTPVSRSSWGTFKTRYH